MTVGLTPLTRDIILQHGRTLPAAPQILAGLCELLQEVNTSLDEIADQIRKDPTLAARVLRVSNSVVFGGGGRVSSIDEAVNRVGFSEMLQLVGVATAAGMVDRALTHYAIPADKLRESLLQHALASEALAIYADVDVRTAYTGGLLRGIGMMVLDRAARGRTPPVEAYDPKQFSLYTDWELARLGITHPEAATIVLDEWRFPSDVVAAIGDHLLARPGAAEDRLTSVINLAGSIVAQSGLALPGDSAAWEFTAEKLEAAGLDEDRYRAASEQARTRFAQQRAALY